MREIPQSLRPLCIGYIEDEVELSQSLARKFKKLGVEIECFENGEEFFKTGPEKYSLILTDKNLPQMNGIEIIKKIRSLKLEIPTAIISGYLDEDALSELGQLGVSAIISKPFETKRLIQLCISEALKYQMRLIYQTSFHQMSGLLQGPENLFKDLQAHHQSSLDQLATIKEFLAQND